MEMFQMFDITPLKEDLGRKYSSITSDGYYFYLANQCQSAISQFDCNFKYIDSFATLKQYDSICFDNKENCFWSCCSKSNNHIYRLDKCFKEVNFIKFEGTKVCKGNIKSIFYSKEKNTLLLTFRNCIVEINKHNGCMLKVVFKCEDGGYNSAIITADKYIVNSKRECSDNIIAYSHDCKPLIYCFLPMEYTFIDMVDCCKREDCQNRNYVYMLAWKSKCYSYIIKGVFVESDDKHCNCEHHGSCKCVDFGESCNDIIESVALVEAAVSHILNAEGEKIQKILSCSNSVCEILEANESVRETITKITHLEQVLYDKLVIAKKLTLKKK